MRDSIGLKHIGKKEARYVSDRQQLILKKSRKVAE